VIGGRKIHENWAISFSRRDWQLTHNLARSIAFSLPAHERIAEERMDNQPLIAEAEGEEKE